MQGKKKKTKNKAIDEHSLVIEWRSDLIYRLLEKVGKHHGIISPKHSTPKLYLARFLNCTTGPSCVDTK